MKTLLLIGFFLLGTMIIVRTEESDNKKVDAAKSNNDHHNDDHNSTHTNTKPKSISKRSLRSRILLVRKLAANFLSLRSGKLYAVLKFLHCLHIKVLEDCYNQVLDCLRSEEPKICLQTATCTAPLVAKCLHILPDHSPYPYV
ncbi:uncharacterized protein LOC113791129 [Dermatophagoides pteronyssinus]|uniref:uncharacterized protein LOC113791129 n=1 Tax=Dermatophagoides pteronyssinus TaxID=6956 RepID=UPI003F676F6E